MDAPQNVLFLYSKYSPNCNYIYDTIKKMSIDFITPLCIDNKTIRERVKRSMYNIKFVPCIMLIYQSGNIEKFEGEQALKWFNEVVVNIIKSRQPEPIQQVPVPPPMTSHPENDDEEEEVVVVQKPKKKKKKVKIVEKVDTESENEEEFIPKKSAKGEAFTSIGDLLGDDTLDDEMSNKPTSIGDGLIDLDAETAAKYEDSAKKKVSQGSSILARAAELQKARDTEDSSKKPTVPR